MAQLKEWLNMRAQEPSTWAGLAIIGVCGALFLLAAVHLGGTWADYREVMLFLLGGVAVGGGLVASKKEPPKGDE